MTWSRAALLAAVALLLAPAIAIDPLQLCNVSTLTGFDGSVFGLDDYRMITAAGALRCLNAISLPYELAHEQIISLAAFYEEFHVFNDIAVEPLNSLHAEKLAVPGIHTFSTNAPMQTRFAALAASFPKGQRVPLARVLFGINSIFQPVRDGSHTSTGLDGAFGYVLGGGGGVADALFTIVNNETNRTNGLHLVNILVKAVNGHVVVTDRRSNRTIVSIGGLKPMNWLKNMASGPFSSNGLKSEGVRLNDLLGTLQTGNAWGFTGAVADLAPLANTSWVVRYSDGSRSVWLPMVALDATLYSSLNIAQLSAMAGTPSQPYLAFKNALNHSGYTPVPPGASHRSLRHRSLAAVHADAAVPGNLIFDANFQPVGNYYIAADSNGRKFAVWKLTTFNALPAANLVGPWNELVAWAKGNKTNRLIYDVAANGGGQLDTGAWALASLYPELLSPNTTYPWLNSNDRRVGPAAKYLVENDLLLDGVVADLAAVTANRTWLAGRVAQLNAHGGAELQLLVNAFRTIAESVDILIANNTQAVSCERGTQQCSPEWDRTYPLLIASIDALPTSKISVAALNDTFSTFTSLLAFFAPFSEVFSITMDGTHSSSLYSNNTQLLRGGILGEYTQRHFVVTSDYVREELPPIPKSPFKQIVAVTDGACGSTCDTFSRTAWFYSFNNPKAASFKYYGFGGTGHQGDMTATSFSGGNAASTDYLSQAWAYYAFAYLTALWSGDSEVIARVDEIGATLPSIPPFTGSSGLPRFTQSEMYQTTLGPYALPMEYNLIPPDFYDKQWFRDYSGPSSYNHYLGGTDLPELYKAAAKYFK